MEGKFAYRFQYKVVTAMQRLEVELSTMEEEESGDESMDSEASE